MQDIRRVGYSPSAEGHSVYSTAPADWARQGKAFDMITIIICLHIVIW